MGEKLGGFNEFIRKQVKEGQNGCCASCFSLKDPLQVHHKTPKKLGGQHTRGNAVGLCAPCHQIYDTVAFVTGRSFDIVGLKEGKEIYFTYKAQMKEVRRLRRRAQELSRAS